MRSIKRRSLLVDGATGRIGTLAVQIGRILGRWTSWPGFWCGGVGARSPRRIIGGALAVTLVLAIVEDAFATDRITWLNPIAAPARSGSSTLSRTRW